ncbi:thioesterase-like superfamily-domain-containing protein [Mycena rebaudengoi]|nr:thioesterase-like superfamily-domain-containing protein [Mycena rebaudengoi]
MERPATPPPRQSTSAAFQLTPEQMKQVELNRLKAKANQRQREEEVSASNVPNTNNKRPLAVTPATSNSPTAPGPSKSKPLQRDSRLGKYFDYDLSKMVNSKGGFLIEDGKEVDEDTLRKEKERERQRIQKNMEPPVYLDPALNPKCRECQSISIDHDYKKVFGCLVCKTCQHAMPEKYSLLTKTECKQDYLLTDPELRDEELLPHMLKANPHASTFANMMLYVRYQVEEFAWKKWGSPEAMDADYERRTAEKSKKKNQEVEQVWQRRKDEEHKHVFGPVCHECGFTVDFEDETLPEEWHEQISTALEVERLDVDLYRSKTLWLPARGRGVFGGQVISQALVAATNSVDPAFGLHCYFLLSASPAVPIVYSVERLRDGRSYLTRAVRARQHGQIVFMMMCSFQKEEPWQPTQQWRMPLVPPPNECQLEEERVAELLKADDVHPRIREIYHQAIQERMRSPIAIKIAAQETGGSLRFMYWMQARDIPAYEGPFQKCILSYISDLFLLSAASRTLGLERFGKGPNATGMMIQSTIDHSICFYDDTFNCGDWLLYAMTSPRAASGRSIVYGQLYTQSGTLIAVTTQEGVVRADRRAPEAKL